MPVPVLSGRKYIYEYSEREFLGVTLLGKAKREAPVRTEPHPTRNKRLRLTSKAGRLTYS